MKTLVTLPWALLCATCLGWLVIFFSDCVPVLDGWSADIDVCFSAVCYPTLYLAFLLRAACLGFMVIDDCLSAVCYLLIYSAACYPRWTNICRSRSSCWRHLLRSFLWPFCVWAFYCDNNKARQLLCSVQDWNTLVLWTSVQETQMPPRRLEAAQGGPAGGDDDSTKQPELFNVANRGLCSMSKAGRLQNAADCSIVLVGTARCSKYNIKGYMMGLKHYPSRVKEVGC